MSLTHNCSTLSIAAWHNKCLHLRTCVSAGNEAVINFEALLCKHSNSMHYIVEMKLNGVVLGV